MLTDRSGYRLNSNHNSKAKLHAIATANPAIKDATNAPHQLQNES